MLGVDVKQVRIFEAIARHRSFTRAAEELHYAQPWLSVQVKRLEDVLGFALFARNRKQAVELTPQAKDFMPAARAFLMAHDSLAREVRLIRRQYAATLALGAPEFSSDIPERPALLQAFQAEFPHIDLDIITGHSLQLLDQLRAGSVDITLALGPFPDDPEFEHVMVTKTQISILVPDDHALAAVDHLSLEDLRGLALGNFRRRLNPPVYDLMAIQFARHGVEFVNFPEATMRSAIHFSVNSRMPVIVLEWMKDVIDGVPGTKLLQLRDRDACLELLLVRRAGDRRPQVQALWSQAEKKVALPPR
ncbi:MAG: LysR family transcriptional regulator [Novosphingobium sp.]